MKVRVLSAIVALLVSVSLAQDARRDAMAGCYLIKDISDVVRNPAFSVDYNNALHLTLDGTATNNIGMIYGSKSIGAMNIGILYDDQYAFPATTYTNMFGYIVPGPGATAIPTAASLMPTTHIIGGFDLSAMKIGLDLFWERANYSNNSETVTAGATSKSEIKNSFSSPGLKAGVNMDISGLSILGDIGMSFPKISSERRDEVPVVGITTTKGVSQGGLAFTAGGEVGVQTAIAELKGGLSFDMLSYKGKIETQLPAPAPAATAYSNKTSDMGIELMVGGTKSMTEENLEIGAMLLAGYESSTTTPNTVTNLAPKTVASDLLTGVVVGIEKGWKLQRIDLFAVRAGLQFVDDISRSHTEGSAAGNSVLSDIRSPTLRSGWVVPLGLGITKGLFDLDFQLDAARVLNIFKVANGQYAPAAGNNNDIVKMSMSFNFGKNSQ